PPLPCPPRNPSRSERRPNLVRRTPANARNVRNAPRDGPRLPDRRPPRLPPARHGPAARLRPPGDRPAARLRAPARLAPRDADAGNVATRVRAAPGLRRAARLRPPGDGSTTGLRAPARLAARDAPPVGRAATGDAPAWHATAWHGRAAARLFPAATVSAGRRVYREHQAVRNGMCNGRVGSRARRSSVAASPLYPAASPPYLAGCAPARHRRRLQPHGAACAEPFSPGMRGWLGLLSSFGPGWKFPRMTYRPLPSAAAHWGF
ncbi:hypothetical protein T492DRAFT_183089, partial [Pavlovales sp. CCMP2436]